MSDLQTDEYGISISREIAVCRNMITRQQKELCRWEKHHGLSTETIVTGETPPEGIPAQDLAAWRDDYAGLCAWKQRLREYEEACQSLKACP